MILPAHAPEGFQNGGVQCRHAGQSLPICGRGGEIRTHDLLLPKQAFYQAELHPEIGGSEHGCDRGVWQEKRGLFYLAAASTISEGSRPKLR